MHSHHSFEGACPLSGRTKSCTTRLTPCFAGGVLQARANNGMKQEQYLPRPANTPRHDCTAVSGSLARNSPARGAWCASDAWQARGMCLTSAEMGPVLATQPTTSQEEPRAMDLQSYPLWWWLDATTGLQGNKSPCQKDQLPSRLLQLDQ